MGNLRRSAGLGFALALVATALISAMPASASSGIKIYVGYADSLRPNAVSFPTPWFGSPNTIFEGCAPDSSCLYDAGAVQVYNGTNSAVQVGAVMVTVGTCVYSGWPSSQLPAGSSLILTQLQSGSGSGCIDNSPANLMDTSDVGPNGSSYTGVCTPDGIIPTVDVTIDGTTTRYLDSGQVLNTGGFDTGVCLGNESTQWTLIGNPPCHSSALVLSPATQTHPISSTATVDATFTACGQPLANALVNFSVTAGPNNGKTGSGTTDGSGQASFTYGSTQTGTDTVGGSITNLAGSITAAPVTVIWTAPFATGGAFVIGDLENQSGNAVNWWGAQWWKNNPLSSGLAPAAFKGFEDSNPAPQCGQTWTTRPGNSSRPPKSVPDTMLVIVASHVTKSGPTISGDITAIVLVKTNPGYAANPGHRGTGTILQLMCGSFTTAPAATAPVRVASHGNPHRRGTAATTAAPQVPVAATPQAAAVKSHGKGRGKH